MKGPKGELQQQVDPDLELNLDDGQLKVQRPTEQKRHKSIHGLYRSLVYNMLVGVQEGYQKQLELVGVGYKASVQGNLLELSLGYSHNIFFAVPGKRFQ